MPITAPTQRCLSVIFPSSLRQLVTQEGNYLNESSGNERGQCQIGVLYQ